MKFLISDLNVSLDGHKLGYVQNLITYLSEIPSENEYYFLINNSNSFKLTDPRKTHINIHYTTQNQEQNIASKNRFLEKAAAQWIVLKEFCQANEINKLVLLEIDPYQLEIGKAKTNFLISGIWFRPYHRLQPESKGLKAYLSNKRYIIQKKLTMQFALRNKNLKNVFVLNDENLGKLNKSIGNRFVSLPDPSFDYPQLVDFKVKQHYKIPKENLILLQFGFIDERKNTKNIIRALNLIESETAKKISLLIIGKFKNGFEKEIENYKTGDFQLIQHNEFISDHQMEATFAQSDIILRMNVGFFGSSGIVGIAANHNKPCIVSDFGVMAEQVTKYKLGDVIDPFNLLEIKNSVLKYLNNRSLLHIDGTPYKNAHRIDTFANILLELG